MSWFDRFKHNSIVIWGTGNRAKECLSILKKRESDVVAFCDNNSAKWGQIEFGISIMSPMEINELCNKERITLVIASSYYEEIIEQVKDYHWTEMFSYQELYKHEACECIASTFNIDKQKITDVIEEKKDALSEELNDCIMYKAKLEERIFELLPDLKPKYGLSVCAILKNEGDYIEEWLTYHMMVGVEHFYLYDNESTDGLPDIIKEYIDKEIVTYIPFPGKVKQMIAYSEAIQKYRMESEYIAFIDADEFLVSVNGENLYSVIDDIFSKHSLAGGIGVNWRTYGTGFREEKGEGLVIENYKYRADDFDPINSHIKTICNPRRAIDFPNNPHAIRYREPYHCISENGSFIPDAFFYDGICRKLRINHYLTKSADEYRKKRMKGRADTDIKYSMKMIEEQLEALKNYNKIYDDIMEKWVTELKKI